MSDAAITDDDRRAAGELWSRLYPIFCSRRRHENVWRAVASLSIEEKFKMDDDAEEIIAEALAKARKQQ
jgi:hypothetical protein